MSGSNAIHGVILVGADDRAGLTPAPAPRRSLGFIAVILATLNVVGGFVVTDRMLQMFRPAASGAAGPDRGRARTAEREPRDGSSTSAICRRDRLHRRPEGPELARKHARRGNLLAAAGMALAIGVTFAQPGLAHVGLIVGAMAIGVAVGVPAARLVKMTAMPQMVASSTASAAGPRRSSRSPSSSASTPRRSPPTRCSRSSSACWSEASRSPAPRIAFVKLQELMTDRPDHLPGAAGRSTGRSASPSWASSSPSSSPRRRALLWVAPRARARARA